jgi:hypothetical protein
MGKRKRKTHPKAKGEPTSQKVGLLVPGMLGAAIVAGAATWFFLQKPGGLTGAAQHQGGPRLAVESDLIDFGTVRFERLVRANFRLRNVGDQVLKLPAYPPVEVVEGC